MLKRLGAGVALVAILFVLEALAVSLCPTAQAASANAATLLPPLGPIGIADVVSLSFSMLSGLIAATCLGLFLGRFESAFLQSSVATVTIFYVYAAIQPLFPVFRIAELRRMLELHHLIHIQYCLKAMALLFKVMLFVFVKRQLVEGRLTFMLREIRLRYSSVGRDWADFQEGLIPTGSRDSAPSLESDFVGPRGLRKQKRSCFRFSGADAHRAKGLRRGVNARNESPSAR